MAIRNINKNFPTGFSMMADPQRQKGGVSVEFFVSLVFLVIFLQFFFDIGQRIAQLSWANQTIYVISHLGSESTNEERSYVQNNLTQENKSVYKPGYGIGYDNKPPKTKTNNSLFSVQNSFWKLNPISSANITESSRTSANENEYVRIDGSTNGFWNPLTKQSTRINFNINTINRMSSIVTDSYNQPSNLKPTSNGYGEAVVMKYDWCGRLCSGDNCPAPNAVGYLNGPNLYPSVICP